MHFVASTALSSKDSVAGVAKAWSDVLVAVQFAINDTGPDWDIRMVLLQTRNTFRCTNDGEHSDILYAPLFECLDYC